MNSERILVRGVNWLGDGVMSTPALLRLREARPQAHLSLLTPEKLADLWHNHPAVDAVLSFSPEESVWRLGRQLRQQHFDLALVLPNSPRSALEVWLARIPQRIGYAGVWRNWFLTCRVPPRPGAAKMRKRSGSEIRRLIAARGESNQSSVVSHQSPLGAPQPAAINHEPSSVPRAGHHIHQYLHLVGALGASTAPLPPRLQVSDQEAEAAGRRLGLLSEPPDARPLFGLNAGAEYGPAKRWPRERFVTAAIELHRRANCRWIVLGGPADLDLAAGITAELAQALGLRVGGPSAPPVLNLAGRTTLRELCAVLKLCRVLLTNDTGPMHVAAAVGTPVVVPFGSTSPELTGPGWPGDSRHVLLQAGVPCAPCFLRECPIDFRCMNRLPVERVVEAVLAVAAPRDARGTGGVA
ncbi:MAG: glycosyltransferase family 9 protein [Verrucomicrobia bacterium]|nr:glycosyltransferase family 9 protein [Verrucomicrobiota bacterium]